MKTHWARVASQQQNPHRNSGLSEGASIDAKSVRMKWRKIDPAVAAGVRTGRVRYHDRSLCLPIPVMAVDQIGAMPGSW